MQKNAICLIIPPSPFLLDERVFMSLGVLYLAAVLEKKGESVEVLDLSGCSNYLDAVRTYLSTAKISHIGVTSTTPQFPAAVRIAGEIRSARADVKIILGGPHATLVVAAKKKEDCRGVQGRAHVAFQQLNTYFDIVVSGDGELAIFEAIKPNAPSLIDGDILKSPLRLTTEDLNELPLPARHLVDADSYHYTVEGFRAFSLITQLGCPFNCAFCAGRASPMLRNIRRRSVDSVIAEMRFLHENFECRGFMLYDDELNINSKSLVILMNRIAEEQKKLGTEWRLRGFVKSELFTDEQAEAMYLAGFRWILTGFESGSPRMLLNINKHATQEDNTRCVEIAHRHGLKVKALMSIGHPGESHETIAETSDWLLKVLRPGDDFDATVITPYPGSLNYDNAVLDTETGEWVYRCENGDALWQKQMDYSTVADYYKGDPNDGYVAYVRTDYLTALQLAEERDALERNVRTKLNIPFNQSMSALRFEHSMGQTSLPTSLLRVTNKTSVV